MLKVVKHLHFGVSDPSVSEKHLINVTSNRLHMKLVLIECYMYLAVFLMYNRPVAGGFSNARRLS